MIRQPILALAGLALLAGCGDGGGSSNEDPNDPVIASSTASTVPEEDRERACKALIAYRFEADPEIMETFVRETGIVTMKYAFNSERVGYGYDCGFDGDRIIWRAHKTGMDNLGEVERWRMENEEFVYRFTVDGNEVTLLPHDYDGNAMAHVTYTIQ